MSVPKYFKQIPNKKFTTYTFDVLPSNSSLFLGLLQKIDQAMNEGESVPSNLLNDLKDLMLPAGYNNKEHYQAKIFEINNQVVEYFTSAQKGEYFFEGIARNENSEVYLEAYSLNNLFLPIIIDYYNHKDETNYLKRDFLLEHFYLMIRDYRDSLSTKKINFANFEHRKIAVMAAYLTHALGFQLSNSKTITHTILFQASRNRLDKYKH